MAFYLVHARPRPETVAELREKLAADAFIDLQPFGKVLSGSLREARREGELAVWEEEDYCTPPLKEERAAVLDSYFTELQVRAVKEGEGWRSIASLPPLFPGAPWSSELRSGTAFGPIDAGVTIGHVHLKVADLQRALNFYCGVLGFELTQRLGESAAFVSAGGYHHHLGLNTWESRGGSPPPAGSTGLYHVAIRYPTRAALADALRRLEAAGIHLEGASDHGVSEALYLSDPDGNGLELYWDRPRESWPRTAAGEVQMFTRALDLEALRRE
jgi:catechol 2,3-dioxygenase